MKGRGWASGGDELRRRRESAGAHEEECGKWGKCGDALASIDNQNC